MRRLAVLFILIFLNCCAYAQQTGDSITRAIPPDTAIIVQSLPDTNTKVVIDTNSQLRNEDLRIAANDTLLKKHDTVNRFKPRFEPNPKKAGLYSAIVPGMGQLYNRQYWKMPVVYAIGAAAGYFINYNLTNYRKYRRAYIARIDGDPRTTDEYIDKYPDPGTLKQLQDESRKYLDITVLLSAVGYSLQVMDAIVSAHLKNFDVSRDISMQMRPVLQNNYIGFGIVMTLK